MEIGLDNTVDIEYAMSMKTKREVKKRFVVCFTERELEILRRKAGEQGLAVSDLIRRIVDEFIAKDESA